MKKKLLAMAMSFLMLIGLLPTAMAAEQQQLTLKLTASQTEARPGDEITFSVVLGKVTGLGSAQVEFSLPEGLTYVSGSVTDEMGVIGKGDDDLYSNDLYKLTSADRYRIEVISNTSVTRTEDTTLATFTCKVKDGYAGELPVLFDEEETDIYLVGGDLPINYTNVTISMILPVTGVTTSPDKMTLVKGESQTLSTEILPSNATNQKVTYTSSNAKVATVDENGKVTAVGEGTATITVTTEDGGFTAICTVTVPHEHTYGTEWKSDGTKHWHECTAGDGAKKDEAEHSGGTATCKELAKCDVCGASYGEYAAHDLTKVGRVEPTHFAPGNIEYWTCATCGKLFSDVDGKNEIAQADTVLPTVPHDYGDQWKNDEQQHWKECGCGNKIEVADYTFVWVTDTAATEESTGLKHEECTICGYTRNEGTVIDKLEHEMTHHDAVAATCVAEGSVEYWSCANCGKNYADEAGTQVLDSITTAIDPDNHAAETEVHGTKDATCTEDGYTGDTYCTACGEKIATGTVIDALSHDLKKVEAREATHASAGNIEYWVCTRGDGYFSDAEGQNAITLEDTVIPQIAHEIDADKWESDAQNHWNACTGCDAHVNEAAHTYGDWTVTKEATATETGVKTRTCTVCGYQETAEIPVIGTINNGQQNNGQDGQKQDDQKNNGQTGSSSTTTSAASSSSQTNGQSKTDNSQKAPKTADQSLLEVSLIVMGVAAVALVTVIVTDKKRTKR